jgi:hypothetical protein
MKLPYFAIADVNKLLDECKNHVEQYTSSDNLSNYLDKHAIRIHESNYILDDAPKLIGTIEADASNAQAIHTWIKSATPAIPRSVLGDGRLWAALSHFTFKDYMTKRWDLKIDSEGNEGEDNESQNSNQNRPKGYGKISGRYFVLGDGQRGVVRNGLSRLYWAAELCYNNGDYSLLKTMFKKQDIHASIIERGMSVDSKLTKAIITKFNEVKNEETALEKKKIQLLAKLINNSGATRTLETVAKNDLGTLFKEVFNNDYP